MFSTYAEEADKKWLVILCRADGVKYALCRIRAEEPIVEVADDIYIIKTETGGF